MRQRALSERGHLHKTPELYGTSHLGHRLEVWLPEDDGETVSTLLLAALHGEEPETTVVLSRALRSLAEPLRGCAVVLAANPDGLMRGTRGNARGVDLNRNFPTGDWKSEPVSHRWVVEEASEVLLSPGASPASEPETQALVTLMDRLAPRRVIALHAPLACIDDPEGSDEAKWLEEATGLPGVRHIGYPTPGSFGTWCAERGQRILTYEFPRESVERLAIDHVPVLSKILAGNWPFV